MECVAKFDVRLIGGAEELCHCIDEIHFYGMGICGQGAMIDLKAMLMDNVLGIRISDDRKGLMA